MLDQQELRLRIRAARVLADISQADMNAAGHDCGLGKHELGAVERGDLDVRHVHLPMLCEVLQVPMSWFTEPREIIVAQRASDYVQAITEIVALVTRSDDVDAAVQALADEGASRQTSRPATSRASRAKSR